MKKLSLIILALFVVVTIGITTAQAGVWYLCNVTGAGQGTTNAFVYLTDTSAPAGFTNRQFTLYTANDKQYLATALTAASIGQTVYAYFPSATGVPAANSVITALFLNSGFK